MDFTVSAEQDELRQVVRAFLGRHSAEPQVRALMATDLGYDPAVWRRMGGELGLQGLAVPEKYGGSGFGPVELGVVFEEAGRALLCAPLLSSAGLAASVLLACDDEDVRADVLPRIARGWSVATVAVTGDGSWAPVGAAAPVAEARAGAWTVTGELTCVLDGLAADVVLLVARTPDGPGLFLVSPGAAGLGRVALPTMDQTRKQARLTLAGTPARLLAAGDAARQILGRALTAGAAYLAAEQAGAAAAATESAVGYAKLRVQYGRPIGSFQGVKHKCADMLVRVEAARSAAAAALWALAGGDDEEAAVAASVAQVVCSDALVRVACDSIQVHGGIGFTWEHPAHLYLKRAKSSELLLGTPSQHRELLAARLAPLTPAT